VKKLLERYNSNSDSYKLLSNFSLRLVVISTALGAVLVREKGFHVHVSWILICQIFDSRSSQMNKITLLDALVKL